MSDHGATINAPGGVLHILWSDVEEVRRVPFKDGAPRWCFVCRKRVPFDLVTMAPVIDYENPSYYGPHHEVRCTVCNGLDSDCFPGTSREWSDE